MSTRTALERPGSAIGDASAPARADISVHNDRDQSVYGEPHRRIRLLALVDVGFVPSHARHDGPAYSVSSGDVEWFRDNIPC
ncbi:MAG TPA: hypothetical protein VHA53_09140, partial [Nitrolancea sp.]|nr:hypothetical protein [Nitrolancea sp.]